MAGDPYLLGRVGGLVASHGGRGEPPVARHQAAARAVVARPRRGDQPGVLPRPSPVLRSRPARLPRPADRASPSTPAAAPASGSRFRGGRAAWAVPCAHGGPGTAGKPRAGAAPSPDRLPLGEPRPTGSRPLRAVRRAAVPAAADTAREDRAATSPHPRAGAMASPSTDPCGVGPAWSPSPPFRCGAGPRAATRHAGNGPGGPPDRSVPRMERVIRRRRPPRDGATRHRVPRAARRATAVLG